METNYTHQASLLQQQHMQQQQFAERILERLAFNSDILERWHQIGSSQGLNTDLEVATFLIQHYEATWDRAQPTEYCLACHSPLSLTCPKCTSIVNGNANTPTPANTNNSAHHPQPSFDQNLPPVDHFDATKKKKKKGKKLRHGSNNDGAGGAMDTNDDDLLGLYIQFGQQPPQQLSGSIDGDLVPFADGKSPPGGSNNNNKKKKRQKIIQRIDPHSLTTDGNGLKTHVCTHCGKTVYKLSDFKKHVRTHTREKPYKCPFCESAFSDASSAARHRRIHTGEKPFKCEACPAAFAQGSDLKKHARVHSQERPWQCQLCQKTFSDSSRFARHRRQHEKEAQRRLKAQGEVMIAEGLDVAAS